jgi:ribosome-binding factor A
VAQHRRDRVAHLIQAELATLLLREARDPRLQTVTITAVRVTADLRLAQVYFRTLTAEAAPREALAALRRATPFLRGALGRALGMRVTPDLRFEYDTTPDTARRVDALLDQARQDGDDEDGNDGGGVS